MKLDQLPKVVLHDHLDGGLRPSTILELAQEQSYPDLPAQEPDALVDWFDQSNSGSLETYLESFRHTIGVMQTIAALERVAYEAVRDHAATGVVYAELRFAPLLHRRRGLSPSDIVRAVLSGARQGQLETEIEVRLILVAMRDEPNALEVARLAVDHRKNRVVAFDLAGPELGYPATYHGDACRAALAGGMGLTLHAGEGAGTDSIADALSCGAQRLGHGVRVVEDCEVNNGRIVSKGPVARSVYEAGIPLEVCVKSELHTGIAESASAHPVGLLHRSGFLVTVNTDNRLMSRTDMLQEFDLLASKQGFEPHDFRRITEQSLAAAFCDAATKRRVVEERVRPVYAPME